MSQNETEDCVNVAEELRNVLEDTDQVIALDLTYTDSDGNTSWRQIWRRDQSSLSFEEFLKNHLNLFYKNGYGSQQLFGEVWLDDNSWLERCEYDGSEWWEHRVRPPLPELPVAKINK